MNKNKKCFQTILLDLRRYFKISRVDCTFKKSKTDKKVTNNGTNSNKPDQ